MKSTTVTASAAVTQLNANDKSIIGLRRGDDEDDGGGGGLE
jgi:hypothetical protein